MVSQLSDRIAQMDEIFNEIDYIRVLLYLDEYNPNVLLEDLEQNLKINVKDTLKIMTDLISLELVKKESDKYQLAEFGKIVVKNLKNI